MDDLKLAQEIISQLEEIGITKIDGHFGYQNRDEPLYISANFGVHDKIRNAAMNLQMIREEIVETLSKYSSDFKDQDDKILEILLVLFMKFYEEDYDDDGARH